MSNESVVSEIENKYKQGMVHLTKLFAMPKDQLIEVVKRIVGDKVPNHVFEGSVKKISDDDVPDKISIRFYDSIEIGAFGISYQPEHGTSRSIVDFNEFFTIPEIIPHEGK